VQRSGLIHADLVRALAGLRHTDLFAVSDSGLPAQPGVQVIDLGLVYGVPDFLSVLRPVLAAVEVEAAWASRDVASQNPEIHRALESLVSPDLLDHDDFKTRIAGCRFVVRTGEATPYANVILRSGVPW
jgi:D-ribose pyranase